VPAKSEYSLGVVCVCLGWQSNPRMAVTLKKKSCQHSCAFRSVTYFASVGENKGTGTYSFTHINATTPGFLTAKDYAPDSCLCATSSVYSRPS